MITENWAQTLVLHRSFLLFQSFDGLDFYVKWCSEWMRIALNNVESTKLKIVAYKNMPMRQRSILSWFCMEIDFLAKFTTNINDGNIKSANASE